MNEILEGKICPYCNKPTEFVDSKAVYAISYGMIYLCRPCLAWVGCHKGTTVALGRLANAELRDLKKKAHFYFDRIWKLKLSNDKPKHVARNEAYQWLSEKLGTPIEFTHIGMFDKDQCKKAIVICKELYR